MSWEEVPQRRSNSLNAPVSASLKPIVGGHTRLTITICPEVKAKLGWSDGELLALVIGRGRNEGRARVAATPRGRPLRRVPRSPFCMVALVPPEDMARWEAPQRQVDEWQVVPFGPGLLPALEIVLPWDLSGDPEASEPEAEVA